MYGRIIHSWGGWIMEASVVDLRYKMKDVLEALERREEVRILYHGRVKGTIIPVASGRRTKMSAHPFFGMKKNEQISVPDLMDRLSRGRYESL
jgi:hypothetical protein